MNVPIDLMDKNINSSSKDSVYLKKYTESANSKIYTHIEKNLLVFILKGIKEVKANDFCEVVAEDNFIFLKKDNVVMNQILNYVDKSYESLLIFIENDYIYEFLEICGDHKYLNEVSTKGYYMGKTTDEMMNELRIIFKLIDNREEYSQNIARLKVKELMIYIAKEDRTNTFRDFLKSCVDEKVDFEKFLEENYDKCKGIKELSEAYSVSLSVFKRKFHSIYNSAPAKWIRDKKLEKASKLLSVTDYNITEISHISGFESLSSFNSSFKKKYGLTPTEYRKKD